MPLRLPAWFRGAFLGGFLLVLAHAGLVSAEQAENSKSVFPLQKDGRVAWVGSSSTNIGVWPKTMEFLLRTRHPELNLSFKKFSTGGGTFATGLQNLDKWLGEFKPTVVFFNYGSNDAGAGEKGLPALKENMEKALTRAKETGARVVFMTPQGADVRKAGEVPAGRRKLYAETMVTLAKEKGWQLVDVHRPLDALQQGGQKDDPAYTILRDNIHLTDPAYVAWGYFLYEGLDPPGGRTAATLTATGEVKATARCKIEDARADGGTITFTRADEVLPILPPGALPPRAYVPLEKLSPYMLQVRGLPEGSYAILCDGKPLGTVKAAELDAGVNLNTVLLDAKNSAPWEALAKDLWAGKALDQVGKTRWRFEIRKN
jgi:lysophospholipase L1-like esterase